MIFPIKTVPVSETRLRTEKWVQVGRDSNMYSASYSALEEMLETRHGPCLPRQAQIQKASTKKSSGSISNAISSAVLENQ